MSRKIFFIILIILIPSIVNADPYESLPSRAQLNADIEKFGAKHVLRDRIWNSNRAFDELFDKISSGDAEWIAIAVKLCAVSDAGVTESLVMAMSRALIKNPVNVLSILPPYYRPGPFDVDDVCSGNMLYINYTEREIEKWRNEAISAVSGVKTEGLEEIKDLCLRSLLHKSNQQKNPSTKLGLDDEIVTLPVVVTTQDGKRVTDLKREDFRIYEDGVEQNISHFETADEPIMVALLLDASASTRISLTHMQEAAIGFVNQLHPDAEVIVLSFTGTVTLQQNITNDRDKNVDGIKGIRSGDSTAIYDAVWMGLEALKLVAKRKALVLITDGQDNSSLKKSQNETLEMAKETKAAIFCIYYDHITAGNLIQYGSVTNPSLPTVFNNLRSRVWGYLENLSSNSGGALFDGTRNLRGAFSEVAKELASQYSIGYYSTNKKHDGKFRRVEIKMAQPDLKARTKKGYYAQKKE